jgi:transcriptional regulator with XRE-family HTH domain
MAKEPNPIDVHVGMRVHVRRTMRGISQSKLGDALNVTFQQVQKYEKGVNRISASRLYQISQTLDVPISYFFDQLPDNISGPKAPGLAKGEGFDGDPLAKQETLKLVNAYYRLPSLKLRNTVRKLVQSLAG